MAKKNNQGKMDISSWTRSESEKELEQWTE